MIDWVLEDDKLYVISGNYREYVWYNLKNNLPHSTTVYVGNPRMLRGLIIKKYVLVGTYYMRNDIEEIYEELKYTTEDNGKQLGLKLWGTNKNEQEQKEFNKMWSDVFSEIVR